MSRYEIKFCQYPSNKKQNGKSFYTPKPSIVKLTFNAENDEEVNSFFEEYQKSGRGKIRLMEVECYDDRVELMK
jgi:hypothetical protein